MGVQIDATGNATFSSFSTKHAGPYQDANGNLWVILATVSGGNNYLGAFKSTDFGVTWQSAILSTSFGANVPTQNCVFDSANGIIYVVVSTGLGSNLVVYKFTISTTTWAQFSTGTGPAIVGSSFSGGTQNASIVKRTSDFVIFYSAPTVSIMGNPYGRVNYVTLSSAGAWGTPVECDGQSGLQSSAFQIDACGGQSSRAHTLMLIGSGLWHASVSSANVLDTPASVYNTSSATYTWQIYYHPSYAGGTVLISGGDQASPSCSFWHATEGASPTWSIDVAISNPNRFYGGCYAWDGTQLHYIFPDGTSNVMRSYQSSSGGSWSGAFSRDTDQFLGGCAETIGATGKAVGVVFMDGTLSNEVAFYSFGSLGNLDAGTIKSSTSPITTYEAQQPIRDAGTISSVSQNLGTEIAGFVEAATVGSVTAQSSSELYAHGYTEAATTPGMTTVTSTEVYAKTYTEAATVGSVSNLVIPAGGVAASVVGNSTYATTAASEASATIPIPAGYQAGDVFYIFVELTAATGTITAPSGYATVVASFHSAAGSTPTSASMAVYRKVLTASESNPAVTGTAGRFAIVGVLVRGADNTTPEDTVATSDVNTSIAYPNCEAPAIAVSSTQALQLLGFSNRNLTNGATTSYTPPSGYTEINDVSSAVATASNAAVEVAQATVSGSIGAQTATMSSSSGTSVNQMGVAVLVRWASYAAGAADIAGYVEGATVGSVTQPSGIDVKPTPYTEAATIQSSTTPIITEIFIRTIEITTVDSQTRPITAFPTPPTLLDDFNRSDQWPPSANWSSRGDYGSGQTWEMNIVGNRISVPPGYYSVDYWNAQQFGPDFSASMDVIGLPDHYMQYSPVFKWEVCCIFDANGSKWEVWFWPYQSANNGLYVEIDYSDPVHGSGNFLSNVYVNSMWPTGYDNYKVEIVNKKIRCYVNDIMVLESSIVGSLVPEVGYVTPILHNSFDPLTGQYLYMDNFRCSQITSVADQLLAIDATTIGLVSIPSSLETAQEVEGATIASATTVTSGEVYTPGGTVYTESGTIASKVTITSTETIQDVEAQTVGSVTTPSSADVSGFTDAATIFTDAQVSGTDVVAYLDAATASIVTTPSTIDLHEIPDSATIFTDAQVSGVDVAAYIDSATCAGVTTPSTIEEHDLYDANTITSKTTPSSTDIAAFVDQATGATVTSLSSVELPAYVETATVESDTDVASTDISAYTEIGTASSITTPIGAELLGQSLVPIADVNVNGWLPSDGVSANYQMIDEMVASDSDYTYAVAI